MLAAAAAILALAAGAPPGTAPESPMKSHAARPAIPPAAELARLPPDGGPRWNRLVFEKSPYLLQHAGNPVDWRPWGDEAFEAARAADKPVFLSIGYATCHWCHVMERESFENEAIAALMNEAFVCIKVDREERPDVDAHYMTVTQAMTGQGGWPMTVILTPDRKPFFAGTYFPPAGRHGRPGMTELVPALAATWRSSRAQVERNAEEARAHVAALARGEPGGDLGADVLDAAFAELAARYDAVHGGFGAAPKFPTPHQLTFLLRHARRTGTQPAVDMVARTLEAMRRGGIWDHVGFGFARYSTDRRWLLPHFEKMLYDQALLAIACLEAHQVTGDAEHARTAREILAYVLRDMRSPEGAFHSAEDADSEGVEGKFYLWTPEQLVEALGPADGAFAIDLFGVVEGGNFRDQATGAPTGESILHLEGPLAATAKRLGVALPALEARMESVRRRLLEARGRRTRPEKDDKILTDWNGLVIAALARSAQVTGDPEHAAAAERAADFVLSRLRTPAGRLLKRYRDGEAGLPAVLDDHAFLSWGLIELYEATFDPRWLEEALAIEEVARAHFWDDRDGGFFLTADDGEKLPVRVKESHDGALPSGNSVEASNLLRLARLTGRPELEERAALTLRSLAGSVARAPSAHCHALAAVDFAIGPSHEVVISGDPAAADTKALVAALRRPFLPRAVILLRPSGPAAERIARLAPFVAAQAPKDGRATAYVCRNFACAAPTTDPARALSLVEAP